MANEDSRHTSSSSPLTNERGVVAESEPVRERVNTGVVLPRMTPALPAVDGGIATIRSTCQLGRPVAGLTPDSLHTDTTWATKWEGAVSGMLTD